MIFRFLSRRLVSGTFTLACCLLAVTGSLRAGDVKYPAETPILSVAVPDGWTSEISNGDLHINTSDGYLYLKITESGAAAQMEPMAGAKAYAKGTGFTDTTFKVNNEEANGVKRHTVFITGKKSDADYQAIVGVIILPDGTKCGLTFLGEKNATTAHKAELEVIFKSIRPAK